MSHVLRQHRSRTCPDLHLLEPAATAEGHSLVARTRQEWQAGVNRFDLPGEVFFLATVEDRIVGMCGLNRDPYLDDSAVGRLRHLYVRPDHRRAGIAAALVGRCLRSASASFERIRLRTSNPSAAALYEALGFAVVHDPTATHLFVFPPAPVID